MSLEIQRYLREGGTFEKLKADYGIDAKVSERHPSLVLFKYDQIESPMGKRIVQECRGIILDSKDNWRVIAFPFTKFFNYGEGHAAKIDWATARVQEKLDGSLMTVYYYGGEWNVASSGNPDAAGEVHGNAFTFRELFWKVWEKMGFQHEWLCSDCSYCFELCTPWNRIVVRHKDESLHLIGVRQIKPDSYPEESIYEYDHRRFNPVHTFPLNSMDGIEATFKNMDPLVQEGYVVLDGAFNRVKVKNPGYVALHHLKDSLMGSDKKLLEIIRTNESEEFLIHFPEYAERFNEIKAKYTGFVDSLEGGYECIRGEKPKVDRKEFALQATKTKLPSYFFARLDGKCESVKGFLKEMQIDHLWKAIGA